MSGSCDFCSNEGPAYDIVKLCCPEGEAICSDCFYAYITPLIKCSNCERPIGKKLGSIKERFQKKGNSSGTQYDSRTVQRNGSMGNLDSFNGMRGMSQMTPMSPIHQMNSMHQIHQMNQNGNWGNQNCQMGGLRPQYPGYSNPPQNWGFQPNYPRNSQEYF